MTKGPQWVKYGARYGWQHVGTIPASKLPGADFWARAARVACAAEGGAIDMVQCYDAGILSAGPLGANVASGTLARLLDCITADVLAYYLGDLAEQHGLGLKNGSFMLGLRPATTAQLHALFLGSTNENIQTTWTPETDEAADAKEWVEALAELFADSRAQYGILQGTTRMIQTYTTREANAAFGLSFVNAEPLIANERGYATWLAYAVNNPKGAERLLAAAGPDADSMLSVAAAGGAWPSTFASRTGRTRAALEAEVWR